MWLYVPDTPPEVTSDDLAVLSLYTGVGMLDEGFAAGWEEIAGQRSSTVCCVERDAYAASCLVARMEDEALDRAPVWDDSESFPCRAYSGKVGAVTAGFPCQPWSNAGQRLGVRDPRWLWPHIARILRGTRAGLLFLENSPPVLCAKEAEDAPGWRYPPGAWIVLRDLAEMGFAAEWCVVSAAAVGACHERQRWFLLAVHDSVCKRLRTEHAVRTGGNRIECASDGSDTDCNGLVAEGLSAQPREGIRNAGGAGEAAGSGTEGEQARGLSKRTRKAKSRSAQRSPHSCSDPQLPARRAASAGQCETAQPDNSIHTGRSKGPSGPCASGTCPDADSKGLPLDAGERGNPQPQRPSAERVRRVPGPDAERDGRTQGTENVCEGQSLAAVLRERFLAPGPHEWGELWDTPLAPAAQSGLRVLDDGVAVVVDASRTDQLRCSGNGVVALEAAVAVVVLGRRLGL